MERGVLQVQVDAIHVLGENRQNKGVMDHIYMVNQGRGDDGSLFLHLDTQTANTSSHGTYPW